MKQIHYLFVMVISVIGMIMLIGAQILIVSENTTGLDRIRYSYWYYVQGGQEEIWLNNTTISPMNYSVSNTTWNISTT